MNLATPLTPICALAPSCEPLFRIPILSVLPIHVSFFSSFRSYATPASGRKVSLVLDFEKSRTKENQHAGSTR